MSKQSGTPALPPEKAVSNAPKGYRLVDRPLVYISWVRKDDVTEDEAWERIFGLYAINRYRIPVMPGLMLNTLYSVFDTSNELTVTSQIDDQMLRKCDECWSFEDRPGHCEDYILQRARELEIPIKHFTFDLREFDYEE